MGFKKYMVDGSKKIKLKDFDTDSSKDDVKKSEIKLKQAENIEKIALLQEKLYAEGKEDGEFDIDNIDLVAEITHYCIKGLEVPYIYGRIAHGMTMEATKPQVAKVVYGALGKINRR